MSKDLVTSNNEFDDEIDLRELFNILKESSRTILISVLACISLSLTYISLTPKTFQATSEYRSPSFLTSPGLFLTIEKLSSIIDELENSNSNSSVKFKNNYSPSQNLNKYLSNFKRLNYQHKFLSNNFPKIYNVYQDKLNKGERIFEHLDPKNKQAQISIKSSLTSDEILAEILNEYSLYIENLTIKEIISELKLTRTIHQETLDLKVSILEKQIIPEDAVELKSKISILKAYNSILQSIIFEPVNTYNIIDLDNTISVKVAPKGSLILVLSIMLGAMLSIGYILIRHSFKS